MKCESRSNRRVEHFIATPACAGRDCARNWQPEWQPDPVRSYPQVVANCVSHCQMRQAANSGEPPGLSLLETSREYNCSATKLSAVCTTPFELPRFPPAPNWR